MATIENAEKVESETRKGRPKRRRTNLTGIRKTATTEQVRDRIEKAISEGEFAPGDKLPSERQFVEMLGVSRVSVREAIRALEAVGMVEVFHGRGSYVAAGRNDAYASSFRGWLVVHRDEVLDLLRIRGALDELAAESTASLGVADGLAAIATAQAEFRVAAEDPESGVDLLVTRDVAFHDSIAAASGSPLLGDLLGELHSYMAESRYVTLSPDGRPTKSASEHDEIVAAIDAGDPVAARAAAARHVEGVRQAITDLLEEAEDE